MLQISSVCDATYKTVPCVTKLLQMADIRQTTKVHVHTHKHTRARALSLSLSHIHTPTHIRSLSLSLTHTHTHTNPSVCPISLQYHSRTHFWFKCSRSHIFSCCWSTFAVFSSSSACSCSLSVTSFWMLASRVDGSMAGSDLQHWMSSSCTHQQISVPHNSVLHNSSSKQSSHSLYLPYVPKTLVTWLHCLVCDLKYSWQFC